MKIIFRTQGTVYSCGAAAMRMALEAFGIRRTERQLCQMMRTSASHGTPQSSFALVAERLKLNFVSARNASFADLERWHSQGYVVIVGFHFPYEKVDHYSVFRGLNRRDILLYDPWWGPKHRLKRTYFWRIWKTDPRYDDDKRWFFALKR